MEDSRGPLAFTPLKYQSTGALAVEDSEERDEKRNQFVPAWHAYGAQFSFFVPQLQPATSSYGGCGVARKILIDRGTLGQLHSSNW